MKIKTIIKQHRRDFTAIMVCEQCGDEWQLIRGYDDKNYHENVIPNMTCGACGEKAPDSYEPRATKYPEGFQI